MYGLECTIYKFTLNLVTNDMIASALIKLTTIYKYIGFLI